MPTSLKHCRKACERLMRMSLSSFKVVASSIPTIPKFNVVLDSQRNRVKFDEHTQPNWWQVPKPVWKEVFETDSGREFLKCLQSTRPFANAVGAFVWIDGITRGSSYPTVERVAQEIVRSYLFAAGIGIWKPQSFESVWKQCVSYFDPAEKELTYVLYAPIWGLLGITRKLSLEDSLEIRRLPHDRMAQIASLNNRLAGIAVAHRHTMWTGHFFVKEFKFLKHISRDEKQRYNSIAKVDCTSWLNEEVALLRALLRISLAVPAYAFVYDGYPRDATADSESLPWRPLLEMLVVQERQSRKQANQYAKYRAQFKSLDSEPGWAAVAASMRRFAIAWENPFPADALADIIAALEGLLVRDNTEVSYKLRIRAADFLAENRPHERDKILKDLRDGYLYRSRVAHGDFVFDNAREWETARAVKRAKGKGGNPFHDVNEVHRLKYELAQYYRAVLRKMIQHGQLDIDWAARGL